MKKLARHTDTLSILPVAEQQQQQHAFTGNDTTIYQQQPSLISTDIGNGAMPTESEKPALPPRDIRNRTSYIAPRESLDELPEGWQHAYGESFTTGWVVMDGGTHIICIKKMITVRFTISMIARVNHDGISQVMLKELPINLQAWHYHPHHHPPPRLFPMKTLN